MAYVLDASSTDAYQYFSCPGTRRVTIQISNAAVLLGFGVGGRGNAPAAVFEVDEPFLPIVGGLNRDCDSIRYKSYAAGVPARLFIAAQP